MNKKKIIGIALAIILLITIVIIAVLSNNIGKNNNSQVLEEENETSNSTFLADYNGEDASWDDSIAEDITLNGNRVVSLRVNDSYEDEGAKAEDKCDGEAGQSLL